MKKPSVPDTSSALSRRDFLVLSSASSAAVLTGCATNPVTGEKDFMLVSEAQELGIGLSFSGKLGNPALGGVALDDFQRRQALYRDAQLALRAVIGARELGLMKPTAFLINTSRLLLAGCTFCAYSFASIPFGNCTR